MTDITEKELLDQGYKIYNGKIENVDLSMEDHGQLTLRMLIKLNGSGVVFGGFTIGFGYLGAEEFRGCEIGITCLMRVMDTVGCSTFNAMKGEIIRVAEKDRIVKIIGNAIEDKWCSPEIIWNKD